MPVARPVPKADWVFREILDACTLLPGEKVRCEFCNHRIRWVHVLQHDAFHRPMGAGCCCAIRLAHDYDAVAAETEAKNHATRLSRFTASKHWKVSVSSPPNVWRFVKIKGRKRERLTLYWKDGRWGVFLNGAYCFDRFASQAEAMATAFTLVERMNGKG